MIVAHLAKARRWSKFFGPVTILRRTLSFRKSRDKTLLDFLSFVVISCGFSASSEADAAMKGTTNSSSQESNKTYHVWETLVSIGHNMH